MAELRPGSRSEISRRTVLRGAAVTGATLAAGLAAAPRASSVHAQWKPSPTMMESYEAAISRPALHYQVFAHDDASHLGLGEHILNSKNASQFSYDEGPDGVLIAAQLYGTADALAYNDSLWERYQLGAAYKVNDPRTGQP